MRGLDEHITGNWGADSVSEELSDAAKTADDQTGLPIFGIQVEDTDHYEKVLIDLGEIHNGAENQGEDGLAAAISNILIQIGVIWPQIEKRSTLWNAPERGATSH